MSARPVRVLVAEPLRVAPELVGRPLAPPLRRLFAHAVDLVILYVPVVAVALGATVASLALGEPAAWRAIRVLSVPSSVVLPVEQRRQAVRDVLPLLVRLEARGVPAAAVEAMEEGDVERAVAALDGYDFSFVLQVGHHAERQLSPKEILLELEKVIPFGARTLALWGVAALYHTLFLSYGRGATPGKRLLGVQVATLSGERLSLIESLERFAAYVEIPATLGFALLALWRDPNRRMPHDRVAQTVALRGRRQTPGPVQATPAPEDPGAAPPTSDSPATPATEPSATPAPSPASEATETNDAST